MFWTELVVIGLMLAINALFAAFELALASVNVKSLEELAQQGKAGAKAALAMKNRMEASLAVVQLGITLVGAIAAAVGGVGADENLSPWMQHQLGLSERMADVLALMAVVLPLSGVTIIFGELVPKTFAIQNAQWVCLKLSPLMRIFALSVYPVVVLFESVTKVLVRALRHPSQPAQPDEVTLSLNELMIEARTMRLNRVINPQQEQVIVGVGRLSKLKIADILVPPSDIKMLNFDAPLTELLITVHLEAHTRFPVAKIPGDVQSIVGYANVKDLFFLAKTHPEDPHVRQIIRQLVRIPFDMPIGEAFALMMTQHIHLALVRDAKGLVCGMVTLEDILEELVGDIQDEFDRLPRMVHVLSTGMMMVGGGLLITDLASRLGVTLSDPQGTTSAWLIRRIGRLPAVNETYRDPAAPNIEFLIRRIRRGKVFEVQINRPPTPGTSPGNIPGSSAVPSSSSSSAGGGGREGATPGSTPAPHSSAENPAENYP